MSKINKYAVIMPRVKHIQHTFDSFEEAEQWMHNTNSGGYIAIIIGEVVAKTESTVEAKSSMVVKVLSTHTTDRYREK